MIKFTEYVAGGQRPLWLSPLQIISVTEGAKGGAWVVLRDEITAQLVDTPIDVQKQVNASLRSLFGGAA